MEKYKICHITTVHESNDNRIFQKECSSLAQEKQFEVYLIAPGESREENDVKVVGLGSTHSNRLKRFIFMTKKAYHKALELNADIYHFHDSELLFAGYILKKKGYIVIFDSHEYTAIQILIKEYIPRLLRILTSKLYFRIESFICKRLDAVIIPVERGNKYSFIGRSKRTVYINNYPKLDEFFIDEQKEKIYDVCHIGSLAKARGVTEMLESIKISNTNIALGGTFQSVSYKEELEGKGLLERCIYFGYCSAEQKVEIYNKSRIGVSVLLPHGQYKEMTNLPTKVYEYMTMKIPVVISDIKYNREIIEEYKFGIIVDPENPKEIANAILYLLNNPEEAKKMGENGYNLVKNNFSWEKDFIKMKNLYYELLEHPCK